MFFGKIDYINLLPFHLFLKKSNLQNSYKKSIEYKKGVPSEINEKFKKRRVNAAFISSIESQRRGIKKLPLGIVAKKSVKSVILKKGILKNDPDSATSNRLAKVLNLKGEVLIGDKALRAFILNPSDYTDLATEWNKRYALPFVFAALCINKNFKKYERLARSFKKENIKIPQYILQKYEIERGVKKSEIKEYLKLISYKINKKEQKGLKLFLKKSNRLKKN